MLCVCVIEMREQTFTRHSYETINTVDPIHMSNKIKFEKKSGLHLQRHNWIHVHMTLASVSMCWFAFAVLVFVCCCCIVQCTSSSGDHTAVASTSIYRSNSVVYYCRSVVVQTSQTQLHVNLCHARTLISLQASFVHIKTSVRFFFNSNSVPYFLSIFFLSFDFIWRANRNRF